MLDITLRHTPTSPVFADLSARVESCAFTHGPHGDAEASIAVLMPALAEQFLYYDRQGLPHLEITDGARTVYAGRLEGVTITSDRGLLLDVYGYAHALSDAPYTALWSDTRTDAWRPITSSERGDAQPGRYAFDTTNRLYISPRKNEAQGSLTGAWFVYQSPDQGSRGIVGIDFSFSALLPSDWLIQLFPLSTSFAAGAAIFSLSATGAAQSGARHFVFSSTPNIAFRIVRNNSTPANHPNDEGANYCIISNIRVVTSTTNRIDTTLTAARAAGTSVTATVGSTAGMYIGQKLVVRDVGSPAGEVVMVESITSSTQFVATFAASYASGATVQAQRVLGSEIAAGMLSQLSALNSTQLSSSAALIQQTPSDFRDESYADADPASVLATLAQLEQWEAGVNRHRQLYLRPRDQAGSALAWYATARDLELQRIIATLYNSTYSVYTDASNRTRRTASAQSSTSVARFGVIRRRALTVRTTDQTFAEALRDAALADTQDPPPRFSVQLDQLAAPGGAPANPWDIESGDRITLTGLSRTLSVDIDQLASFRVSSRTVTLRRDAPPSLSVEPETPLPRVDVMLARAEEFR